MCNLESRLGFRFDGARRVCRCDCPVELMALLSNVIGKLPDAITTKKNQKSKTQDAEGRLRTARRSPLSITITGLNDDGAS